MPCLVVLITVQAHRSRCAPTTPHTPVPTVAYLPAVQGFIVNRILMPMINEAFFALMEVRQKPDDAMSPWTWPAYACRSQALQQNLTSVPVLGFSAPSEHRRCPSPMHFHMTSSQLTLFAIVLCEGTHQTRAVLTR